MKKTYSVTTVKIEDGIKEKLKIKAIQLGVKLQDLINDILRDDVEKPENSKSKK